MNIKKTIKNLEQRGYKVGFFNSKEDASEYLSEQLKNRKIGIGGSETINQMNLYDKLSIENKVYWHWKSQDENILNKAANAEVYITSANAISENGEIINIDGRGNRISAQVYGGKKLYIVIGTNKICPDLEKAFYRARNIAAVKNAKRLNKETPCNADNKCHDCHSPQRICRAMLISWGPVMGTDAEVIIINEILGF